MSLGISDRGKSELLKKHLGATASAAETQSSPSTAAHEQSNSESIESSSADGGGETTADLPKETKSTITNANNVKIETVSCL